MCQRIVVRFAVPFSVRFAVMRGMGECACRATESVLVRTRIVKVSIRIRIRIRIRVRVRVRDGVRIRAENCLTFS